jgi:peptidoglycan/xylan/chitin deacetylase (PgdA/CDA1 family)
MNRFVLLSFDVEEFDMPLEYGYPIELEEQMAVGKKGLDALMPLLTQTRFKSTLFTTGRFAEAFPQTIRDLSTTHEIASHTYNHTSFQTSDLSLSKKVLESIIERPVKGLRMPRMRMQPAQRTLEAGYEYDASVHPIWLPGHYNNLHLPRNCYLESGLKRMPASVTPLLRIPLFWLSFKNFPLAIYTKMALNILKKEGYLSLYYHPWEFTDITNYRLPAFTTRFCGPRMVERLERLTQRLAQEGEFIHMNEFAENQKFKHFLI